MPLSPRKCWGKNVKFTPINIIKNWDLDQIGCIVRPENKGNQWLNPANNANTAPIDKT